MIPLAIGIAAGYLLALALGRAVARADRRAGQLESDRCWKETL